MSLYLSALDADSEMVVQKSIDSLLKQSKSITTVVVAHRLRTVRNADCIGVIKEGQIIEIGCHTELMSIEKGYTVSKPHKGIPVIVCMVSLQSFIPFILIRFLYNCTDVVPV